MPAQPSVPAAEVGANVPGVECPQASAVKVMLGRGAQAREAHLHANRIAFERASPAAAAVGPPQGERVVCAGQAPKQFHLCERFLIQGLDSGRGLFQFVSPRRHLLSGQADDRTVAGQVRAQFAAASAASEALILGGRYQVTAVDMIPGDQPDTFSLRVRADDLNNPGQSRSMIITQAGLRFDDNVLRVTEIERANALMGPHLSTGGFDATRQDVDPMVVSNVGIGRNATLICYREAIARLGEIKEENELNGLLQEIILAGRRDRGPHFIHREAQLNELQAAVRKEYLRRQALRPDEP